MKHLTIVGFLLILMGICIASNIYTLIPIYENIARNMNRTVEQTIFGSSVFSICYACGLLIFGPVSEKIGRKKVIITGLFFSFLTTGVVGFAFDETSLYMFRGLQGFALGTFAPVAFAYTFELFPIKHRTLVLALINSGFLIAGILGQLISTALTNLYSWEYVFYSFALIYLLLFLSGIIFLPNIPLVQRNGTSIVKDMLLLVRDPSLFKCYVITFSILLSFVSFYDGIGRFLREVYSVNDETLFHIRAIGLIGASLSFFAGKIVKKIGDKQTLVTGLLLTICSLLLLLFAISPFLIAIFSIPFVAALSLLYPSIISIIGTIGQHNRGSAISLYSFTLLVGASIGPIIANVIDFPVLLLSLTGMFLLNLFLSLRINM
ncbi:MFS transporter [Fredinandcohnia humi]